MITSIVIATYNKLEYTQQCLESIRRYTEPGTYEIIVVDNASKDNTAAWLLMQSDIKPILNHTNEGFPQACNQGIEIAKGDAILLLNNDTIVTSGWLTNMLTCLNSSLTIGAVGTVTNNCSYYQTVPIEYTNLDEMQQFAERFNESNPDLWEERLKLIGYNLLIRRSVLDQVGRLDIRFTPGNYEDDDLSWRIRQAGYRLLLCKDTFIHHFGSVSFSQHQTEATRQLMQNNKKKFIEKWGINPDEGTEIRYDLVELIRKPTDCRLKVLVVGCRAGGTLLAVKTKFPNAVLYGVEQSKEEAASAGIVAGVFVGQLEEVIHQFPSNYFDVIMLHNTFHTASNKLQVLVDLIHLLVPGGMLSAIVPNLAQPHILYGLLDGTISREQLSAMTVREIYGLLEQSGFTEGVITGIFNGITDHDIVLLKMIASYRGTSDSANFNMAEFIVRAYKPLVPDVERWGQENVDVWKYEGVIGVL